MMTRLLTIASSAVLLAACNEATDMAQDQTNQAAPAPAAVNGPAEGVAGLSDAILLDADLRGPDNADLGDVVSLARDANDEVDRLLVEIDDTNPDRFVYVPVSGLRVVGRGDDTDVATDMSRDELTALPDAGAGALGLNESQLLDAELIGPNNTELGEVESLAWSANGEVDRLLIEIDDTSPNRYVHVPISDLTPLTRGDDTDLSTEMTREELVALPDAQFR